MRNNVWQFLFFAVLLLELMAISQNWHQMRFVTKPLLITFLLAHFLQQSNGLHKVKYFMVAALFFSWLGDVLLLLENKHPLYFISGLGSFLTAHIFYILFFMSVRKQQHHPPAWNILMVVAATIYAAVLFFVLNPYLGNLKVPVLIYAVVICSMFIVSVHAFTHRYSRTALFCITGALLFIISDSLLAIHKFYTAFKGAGIGIMLTYALAQWGIVTGSLQFLKQQPTHQTNIG